MEADNWSVWGAVPEAGDTVSQLLSLAAVKVRVPLPLLVTFTVAGDGLLPPTVAENGIVIGETERTAAFSPNAPTMPPPE
jgi:hypothetical protein